jgi:hypothetical protein
VVALKPFPAAAPAVSPRRSRNAVVALKRRWGLGFVWVEFFEKQERRGGIETMKRMKKRLKAWGKQERRGGIETDMGRRAIYPVHRSRNAVVALKLQPEDPFTSIHVNEAGTP